MARIIAIANQKGGVGKTTTAVNLSTGLVLLGQKVLVIDLDPQANASITFGVDIGNLRISMREVLLDPDMDLRYNIFKKGDLHIAPSNLHLSKTQKEMYGVTNGELVLRRKLAPLSDEYDFIILDTPPTLGPLLNAALNACHEVFIPIDVGYYALIGITELLSEVEAIKITNPHIDVTGVLLTKVDTTNLTKEIQTAVREEFGDRCFNTGIRKNVTLAEAPSHRQSVFEYDDRSHGAVDYLNLAREVLQWRKPREKAPEADADRVAQTGNA